MKIESHRDLIVWQKSMDMAVQIYEFTTNFPTTETYRITSQITRAAVSVPTNIAEGHGRSSSKNDYAHFLAISKGSLMETETLLMLSTRLNYLTPKQADPTLSLITEISKMLTILRHRILK